MSLVNDVLKDLQAREASTSFRLGDLKPAEWSRRRLMRTMAPPFFALLIVVPVYAAWQWKTGLPEGAPEARYALQEVVLPVRVERPRVALEPVVVDVARIERAADDMPRQLVPQDDISEVLARTESKARPQPAPVQRSQPPVEAKPKEPSTVAAPAARLVKRTTTNPKTHATAAIDPSLLAMRHARELITQGELSQALFVLSSHRPARASADYDALMAWLLQRNQQHGEAAEIYRKLVFVSPNAGEWWMGLAISLESLGREAEALQAFERAQSSGVLKAPLAAYATQRIAALKPGKPSR